MTDQTSFFGRLKTLLTGGARNPHDKRVYEALSLAAFLAWVGLGADGLSSSCYGPPEAYSVLLDATHHAAYPHLGLFVALATAVTVLVISASYSQIIELFPSGGGGYLVASKLLSPVAGAVSGCALLVDYVLTIAISIASGMDALFSFLPEDWLKWKLVAAVGTILLLTMLNLRGVRESVAPLVPVFIIFLVTHLLAIVGALVMRGGDYGTTLRATATEMHAAHSELGLFGLLFLMMHSYSMGAGTYTGIEAVSNGMPMLREPRVQTAKRTMTLMAVSLAVTASGLMCAYLLLQVTPDPHKTLNAVLMERFTASWPHGWGAAFVITTLLSEAAILCVAAQTGFLGGPRILANMALDRWMPSHFSVLSDRLVTQNGVLLMSAAAIVTVALPSLLHKDAVPFLVVLYSINVFITFALSQTGMVRHWWQHRRKVQGWQRKLFINGVGLSLTLFILVWMTTAKFLEGGWITLVITAALVLGVVLIRREYASITRSFARLDELGKSLIAGGRLGSRKVPEQIVCDPRARTAVLLVGGFNGLGLHSLLNIIRYFGDTYQNFVFLQVGMIDAGNFKGADETEKLELHVRQMAEKYVDIMRREGYYAEAFCSVGADVADEIATLAPQITAKFPNSVFFAGQLIFPQETFLTRLLHNNVTFVVQQRIYRRGIPFVIMPFRVG